MFVLNSRDDGSFCGPPKLEMGRLFASDCANGIHAWFANDRIFYSLNARTAIRKACDILKIGAGDEVLAPAYNCGSEIDPLLRTGAQVSLYPVDRSTNVDPIEVEKRISSRTRLIYATHYFGFAQPAIKALKTLCAERNISLIEDCALSLFSRTEDGHIGQYGDISIFCFYKFIPLIGGGAMIINNKELVGSFPFTRSPPAFFTASAMARNLIPPAFKTSLRGLLRLPVSDVQEPSDQPDMPSHYYFDTRFTDARMSRITAQLLGTYDTDELVRRRRENFIHYQREFSGIKGLHPLFEKLPDGVCPLSFPIIAPNRNALCNQLNARNIEATPWWSGYHRDLDWNEFSDTLFLKDSVLTLPLHHGIGGRHVAYIVEQLRNLVD